MSRSDVTSEARHPDEWKALVVEAVDAARERDAALRAPVTDSARPRISLRMALLAVPVASLVFLWATVGGISLGLPAEKQVMDLAWLVRDAVDVVTARATPDEPWPSETSIDGLLPAALHYEVLPDGFRIIATAGEVQIEYRSDQDPDVWVQDRISEGVTR